jgi:hypothetical protein
MRKGFDSLEMQAHSVRGKDPFSAACSASAVPPPGAFGKAGGTINGELPYPRAAG